MMLVTVHVIGYAAHTVLMLGITGTAISSQSMRRRHTPVMDITVGINDFPAPLIAPERISIAMYVMYVGTMKRSISMPMSMTAASVVKSM